jgi:hypothetical protein
MRLNPVFMHVSQTLNGEACDHAGIAAQESTPRPGDATTQHALCKQNAQAAITKIANAGNEFNQTGVAQPHKKRGSRSCPNTAAPGSGRLHELSVRPFPNPQEKMRALCDPHRRAAIAKNVKTKNRIRQARWRVACMARLRLRKSSNAETILTNRAPKMFLSANIGQ